MPGNNNALFECLLQGLLRELDRLYWNHNQKHFYDEDRMSSCWEWWPGGLHDFNFGNLEFKFLPDPDEGGGWVRLKCGGREFNNLEVSGKRIGMYGPRIPMTDYEMVDWFNQSLKDIGSR